jgi:hypothetical protein
MRVKLLLLFVCISWIHENTNAQLQDTLSQNHYYNSEIFSEEYISIYNKWRLMSISGGFTGEGYNPDFEVMEITKFGIYKLYRNDSLLHLGKIEIEEVNADNIIISFISDTCIGDITFYDMIKYVYANDFNDSTLNLIAPCCDRYSYHFESPDTINDNTSVRAFYRSKNMIVFPNPANDVLHFRRNEINDDCLNYEIYNLKGQLLRRDLLLKPELNVSFLAEGIYIIKIIYDKIVYNEKIVIK